MLGCPLRNTCVRPSWLTGRRDQRPARGGLIADLFRPGVLNSNVGLPAKATAHSALMQAEPPPSRARLAVDTDLINDQKPVCERACSRWRPDSRPRLWEWSDKLPDSSRFFRRVLAVAGWEGLSLTFSCRCKFSDRAWKPEVDGAKAPFITYADGRFLTLLSLWRLCAGDLRVCRARLPRFSNLRTAATHSLGNERGSSNQ
ncbi:hypothetical protein SAMN03159382_04324 [Pseudomonas sp. NFACC23-1]|nr:hypothetical protein SAMN03159386_04379 [Pseudomonas sp. NFACC17-2]SEJ78149.1 hypothetical protein SAMN03159382_04324 [Pseudomonas sp. NFACC23-1]SFW80130.1 hypothetical protein SAMN05660640_03760 [Pseudomonas sp. NFACC16-2]